jgi:hypothetical protein
VSQAWATVLIGIASVIGSAAVSLFLVGVYIGRYQGDVKDLKAWRDEQDADDKDRRELLSNIRERLRWCESRLNGTAWKKGV